VTSASTTSPCRADSGTLSGGESQRIRLASQIGSGLTGVLYVLDEPSIGLHQRDNTGCSTRSKRLRDLGNTVIVVEHDEDAIRTADHVVDMGPGAGVHGGRSSPRARPTTSWPTPSLTGQYLSGRADRRAEGAPQGPGARSKGARGNNLKNVTPAFRWAVHLRHRRVGRRQVHADHRDALQGVARKLNGAREHAGPARRSRGSSCSTRSSTSTSRRSAARRARTRPPTPAPSRRSATGSPDSRKPRRAAMAGALLFNVKGGRCEACQGDGVIKIEMHFLPDVYVTCEVCKGKRYNRETLEVKFKGKSIADVLDMTVEEAPSSSRPCPAIREKMETLKRRRPRLHQGRPAGDHAVGRRGAAREAVKELSSAAPPAARSTSSTSRPPACTSRTCASCWKCCMKLVDQGNTVVVIEHNLDVIKTADWIIDLGPEGGDGGGEIVADDGSSIRSPTSLALRPQLSPYATGVP
jgi:excinuclease ABC subunit A